MKRWNYFGVSGPPPFVGSYVGNLALVTAFARGIAYSPVNQQVYYANFSAKLVCRIDPSGSGSLLSPDIATTNSPRYLAYLPVSNKILVVYGTNNYQLIDCATNTIGTLTAFSAGFTLPSSQSSSSFAVDPTNDEVFICSSYEIRKLIPGTGVMTGTGFGTYAWLSDEVFEVAFNPADGYVYAAFASHRLKVVTPSNWALAPIIDHSTPNLDANSRVWVNRSSGKVWLSSNIAGLKHYIASSSAISNVATASTPGAGDYDSVVEGVFALEQGATGVMKQFSATDALAVSTTVGGNLVNPLEMAAAPALGRYVLFRAGGNSVDVVAR